MDIDAEGQDFGEFDIFAMLAVWLDGYDNFNKESFDKAEPEHNVEFTKEITKQNG